GRRAGVGRLTEASAAVRDGRGGRQGDGRGGRQGDGRGDGDQDGSAPAARRSGLVSADVVHADDLRLPASPRRRAPVASLACVARGTAGRAVQLRLTPPYSEGMTTAPTGHG